MSRGFIGQVGRTAEELGSGGVFGTAGGPAPERVRVFPPEQWPKSRRLTDEEVAEVEKQKEGS